MINIDYFAPKFNLHLMINTTLQHYYLLSVRFNVLVTRSILELVKKSGY